MLGWPASAGASWGAMERPGSLWFWVSLSGYLVSEVSGTPHECNIILAIESERDKCLGYAEVDNQTSGCRSVFDNITCWPAANEGEIKVIACPAYFTMFSTVQGNVSRNCTSNGWSELQLATYITACGYDPNTTAPAETIFYGTVKTGYTIGHSLSLIALTMAMIVLCIFRKLHCTRNYIHMHLFMSFIMRAIAVFVKDVILFESGESDNCHVSTLDPEYKNGTWHSNIKYGRYIVEGFHGRRTFFVEDLPGCMTVVLAVYFLTFHQQLWLASSEVGCKAAMVFFQYCVMANFFWLLVEGLYLHTLLVISFFSEKKYFWWYILIGWGAPTLFTSAWAFTKVHYDDVGCWDLIEPHYWWIIKAPIVVSILVNFILFICIIQILVQKLHSPDVGRNETSQYSRLAKSTLLLIPLFGIHYIMFAFFPDTAKKEIREVRLVFELVLGSFQGFVVAILYCFLNGEVQAELKRKWRRWHMERFLGSDLKYHQPSLGSSGTNFSTQISMLTKCSPKTRRCSSFQADLSLV